MLIVMPVVAHVALNNPTHSEIAAASNARLDEMQDREAAKQALDEAQKEVEKRIARLRK